MENREEVTLKTLNVKLDKILEKVSVNTSAAAEKSTSKQHNSDIEVPAVLTWIKHTRSMAEILERGFEYEEDSGLLSCSVCGDDNVAGTFYYSAENGLEFDESEYLPRDFSNLKRNIIRHIKESRSHFNAVSDI